MPKDKNTSTSWETTVSPELINKSYKIWAIIATVLATVLAVAVTVLVIALTITVGDANRPKSEQTNNTSTDSTEQQVPPEDQPANVDISKLDASKLITKADLPDGEIPDHYVGDKNAKVVVIEYEDFACSHCQVLAQYTEQIHADYKDRVLFIHRGFNLGFPNSARTLRAAEAAYRLGGDKAYWAMSKLLYQDTRWTGEEVFGSEFFGWRAI